MSWEMIIVFTLLSVAMGLFMGFTENFRVGLFFFLLGMGLTMSAFIMMLTNDDGFLAWVSGPVITFLPFYFILKKKYPHKLKQLNDDLKFSNKK